MTTRALLTMAGTEIRRSFGSVGGRIAGGRDFVWLTLSLSLMIAFTTLLLAIERDVLENFVDSLLGKVEGAGIPIQVTVSPAAMALGHGNRAFTVFDRSGPRPTPSTGSDRFVAPGLEGIAFHPVAEVETDVLALPGNESALARGDLNDQGVFAGLATAMNTPLWRSLGVPGGPEAALTIVANRAWFQRWFSEERHLAALSDQLPRAAVERIARDLERGRTTVARMNFTVPDAVDRSVVSLPIRWVSSLPGGNGRAFVMSAELHHALVHGARAKRLFVDLPRDGHGADRPLIRSVRIFDTDKEGKQPEALARQISDCLHAGSRSGGGDLNLFMDFAEALPKAWVEACLVRLHLPAEVRVGYVEDGRKPIMTLGVGDVDLDCAAIAKLPLVDEGDAAACAGRRDGIRRPLLSDATVGILYVADRRNLSQTHRALVAARYEHAGQSQPVFFVSSVYRDAINRLEYLVGVFDFLRLPAAVAGIALVSVVLWVQISALLANRRSQYGLLLIQGADWKLIHLQVAVQIATCFAVAAIGALVAVECLAGLTQHLFADGAAAVHAREELGIRAPTILHPMFVALMEGDAASARRIATSYGLAVAGMVAITGVITTWATLRLPCGRTTTPIELISPERRGRVAEVEAHPRPGGRPARRKPEETSS